MTEILNPIISDMCDIHVIRIEEVNNKRISYKMVEFEGEISNIHIIQWDKENEETGEAVYLERSEAENKFTKELEKMKAANDIDESVIKAGLYHLKLRLKEQLKMMHALVHQEDQDTEKIEIMELQIEQTSKAIDRTENVLIIMQIERGNDK